MIQISTPDHMVLFDLEKQVEVGSLLNSSQLKDNMNDFVDPGFVQYDLSQKGI